MDHTKDYYAILEVTTYADQVAIQVAYKALAQKYHPDKLSGRNLAENLMMSAINEAHSILGDPLKRAQYDRLRRVLFQEANSPPKEPLTGSKQEPLTGFAAYWAARRPSRKRNAD